VQGNGTIPVYIWFVLHYYFRFDFHNSIKQILASSQGVSPGGNHQEGGFLVEILGGEVVVLERQPNDKFSFLAFSQN